MCKQQPDPKLDNVLVLLDLCDCDFCLLIHRSEKEMNRRKDMVGNLRSKANQVASALNMSNFANRDSLLGPEMKPDDAMNRVSGMDNQGIVGFQRQVMRGKLCYMSLCPRTIVTNQVASLFDWFFFVCLFVHE